MAKSGGVFKPEVAGGLPNYIIHLLKRKPGYIKKFLTAVPLESRK
jgi:hypothetical protein